MSTDDGHKVYFSGEEGKHEYGVGFLVHKDVVGAVLGCQPVSSRLISIRLRAAPFNITIIQVYAIVPIVKSTDFFSQCIFHLHFNASKVYNGVSTDLLLDIFNLT